MFNKSIAFLTGKDRTHYLVLFGFTLVYGCFLLPFVAHEGLSTFASDSPYYLLMARYLSPWHEPSPAIIAAWPPMQDLPPLFPFILAISGAAYSYTFAHILTALFLLLSIPLIFIFGRSMFADHWQALIVVLIFCLSPAAWLNSLGILSENLYLLLSLITLIMFDKADFSKKINLFLFGPLLALLILTRTIGVAMLAAFIILCIIRWRQRRIDRQYFVIPIFVALTVITLFQIHSATIPTQYIDQLGDLFAANSEDTRLPWQIKRQLTAFSDAWLAGLMYHRNEQTVIAQSLLMPVGLLSLCGLLIRIKQLQFDAIYILFYLLILFIWPHPNHSTRFLYPVLCILIMYAFYAISFFIKHIDRANTLLSLAMLLVLMTVLPTLSYTWHRYHIGKQWGYHQIAEFYNYPDVEQAKKSAAIRLAIFREIEHLGEITDPEAVIMYFEPAYIFLLANRISRKTAFKKNGGFYIKRYPDADYIYLTKLHPRPPRQEDINGLDAYPYISDWTQLLWSHYRPEDNEHIASFFKITH